MGRGPRLDLAVGMKMIAVAEAKRMAQDAARADPMARAPVRTGLGISTILMLVIGIGLLLGIIFFVWLR